MNGDILALDVLRIVIPEGFTFQFEVSYGVSIDWSDIKL